MLAGCSNRWRAIFKTAHKTPWTAAVLSGCDCPAFRLCVVWPNLRACPCPYKLKVRRAQHGTVNGKQMRAPVPRTPHHEYHHVPSMESAVLVAYRYIVYMPGGDWWRPVNHTSPQIPVIQWSLPSHKGKSHCKCKVSICSNPKCPRVLGNENLWSHQRYQTVHTNRSHRDKPLLITDLPGEDRTKKIPNSPKQIEMHFRESSSPPPLQSSDRGDYPENIRNAVNDCTFGSKSVSLRQCRSGVPWIARQDTAL